MTGKVKCKGKTIREGGWYEMEEQTVGNAEV